MGKSIRQILVKQPVHFIDFVLLIIEAECAGLCLTCFVRPEDSSKLAATCILLCYRLIQKHIKELCKVISPTHEKLCIPRMYHLECPWPAAQREIYMINAYKVTVT